jgi:hypothetical protein
MGPKNVSNNISSVYKSVNTTTGNKNHTTGIIAATASGSQIVGGPESHNLFK